MSEIIPFGRTSDRSTNKQKPGKNKADTLNSKFGNDEYLLKWCAEWRAARAQQEKNWAVHSLATGWGHLEDNGVSLDLSPVERMEELQWHLSMAKPRTMLLARELLGICGL